MQRGIPLPEKIANAPELYPGLLLYYRCFLDLSSCRVNGMSLGPIPWDKIVMWGGIHGFMGEELQDLCYLVAKMDSAYLEYYTEKEKKRRTDNGKPG